MWVRNILGTLMRLIKGGLLISMLFLNSCGTAYTGVEGNAGPVNVAIILNSNKEFILDTSISVPLVGNEYLGANWVIGYETVIGKAQSSDYKLFIVWEDETNDVWMNEYDVQQKFKVTFADNQVVKKIESAGNGSVVVSVDISARTSINSSSNSSESNDENSSCGGTTLSKIKINKSAYVCTETDRLIVREVPGGSEILRLYPQEVVSVIGGPKCYDSATWWQINIPSGTKSTVGQTDLEDFFYTNSEVTGWVREGGDYLDPYYICQ